jgi:hypothetical protein
MTASTLDNVVPLAKRSRPGGSITAATRLYDAEVALHIARQTGVDRWVAAAYDRLHQAIAAHRAIDGQRAARPAS